MGHINGKYQPHSYAWRLFDNIPSGSTYSSLDPDFLAMVAACQRRRPEERPSLLNLVQKVFEAEQAGRMAPSDETRDFWYAALDPRGYVSGGSTLPPKPGQPFSFDADNNDEEAVHPKSKEPSVQQARVRLVQGWPVQRWLVLSKLQKTETLRRHRQGNWHSLRMEKLRLWREQLRGRSWKPGSWWLIESVAVVSGTIADRRGSRLSDG